MTPFERFETLRGLAGIAHSNRPRRHLDSPQIDRDFAAMRHAEATDRIVAELHEMEAGGLMAFLADLLLAAYGTSTPPD